MQYLIIKLLYSIEGIGAVCGVTVVLIFGLTILGLSCGIQVGHHFFQMRGLGCLGFKIMKRIHRKSVFNSSAKLWRRPRSRSWSGSRFFYWPGMPSLWYWTRSWSWGSVWKECVVTTFTYPQEPGRNVFLVLLEKLGQSTGPIVRRDYGMIDLFPLDIVLEGGFHSFGV